MRPSCAALAVTVGIVVALPASEQSAPLSLPLRTRDDDFDPFDLSFVKKFAAIGDSYSAGIGAGNRLGGLDDWSCSRYDHAYPNLMNGDAMLGDPSQRTFEFHSCSGAVVSDVVDDQLPHISNNQDIITLSAGGNDAQLVDVLNACVFQWFAFETNSMDKAAIQLLKLWSARLGLTFEKMGRGCAAQLETSQGLIESSDFAKSLDNMLSQTKKKLASGGKIYYTGYAKFFDAHYDSACDDVSWSIWSISDKIHYYTKNYLTSGNRRKMNDLVDLMNEKLTAAVERAGPQVEFVDYDEYVQMLDGTYCVPGVDETTRTSNTRSGLMFYELNTLDPLGHNPWKREPREYPNDTFAGQTNLYAKLTMEMDPDAELAQADNIEDQGGASALSQQAIENAAVPVPNILPDGYGRSFHPQILLHNLIAKLVLWRIAENNMEKNGWDAVPEIDSVNPTCPLDPGPDDVPVVLRYKGTKPGKQIKKGTELRILPMGDSITEGWMSGFDGGDGDGYRRQLRDNLSQDKVVFAGTETSGTMEDGYYAAWSGKTIQYIHQHSYDSLAQRPNIVLIAAGTNDMNPSSSISKEGNDPEGAAHRLGKLIELVADKNGEAVVLVAMIINTCDPNQSPRTKEFQKLIPGVVEEQRKKSNGHVFAVDFTDISTDYLRSDCIHPTNEGYKLMGDYWYDFITQIPSEWIEKPIGGDPHPDNSGKEANGGIDKSIPAPDWGTSPIKQTSKGHIRDAFNRAYPEKDPERAYAPMCKGNPIWASTGQIALGAGVNGDWQYHKWWEAAGVVASGLGLENAYVRLHDMNGDGKADYVWIHPQTGEIRCWINNLPDYWTPAGSNTGDMKGVIGSGVDAAKKVYLADMNGDGMDDYLVVNPDDGSVKIWWNYGPDENWVNGWKFVAGGQIASGVTHANLATLRFPDINGDGRADYVYIGAGGALKHWLNVGTPGGQDVLFHAQGGIATGAVEDISKLVFADMNGDGRDDYLIWDNDGGLSGYLNRRTNAEGVPLYIYQGGAKSIADGIGENPKTIRLADMDGDGKDDYVHIGDEGALKVWYNGGTTDDSMGIDGLRFARLSNNKRDDYVWLDPKTGAPYLYTNKGPQENDILGWLWYKENDGKPIASGAAPAKYVHFADVDGDGYDDYITLDPKTGQCTAYLFWPDDNGEDGHEYGNWRFHPGRVMRKSEHISREYDDNLGPVKNVRFADIDGDGRDDYIYLNETGGAVVYLAHYFENFYPTPAADALGIGQRPEEISFHDINGDGKADYIWTRPHDGRIEAWLNMYPELPAWHHVGELGSGVGTSGANVRYGQLTVNGRADYIAVDPTSGGLAGWLNGCNDLDTEGGKNAMTIARLDGERDVSFSAWTAHQHEKVDGVPDYCYEGILYPDEIHGEPPKYPGYFAATLSFKETASEVSCTYQGSAVSIGQAVCGVPQGRRHRAYCFSTSDTDDEEKITCKKGWKKGWRFYPKIKCVW